MKKSLIIVCMLAVLLTPSFSFAQVTNEDLQAQIATLTAQVAELQKLLALMQQIEQLSAQLASLQAVQTQQGQVLGAVQQQTAPVVVAKPTPPPLTKTQILEKQFSDKETECASKKIGWVEIFTRSKDWFNSPNRTDREKEGFYGSDLWIDSYLRNNFENKVDGSPVASIANYCNWGKYEDSQMRSGCEVVLEVKKPFIACMLGQ